MIVGPLIVVLAIALMFIRAVEFFARLASQ